MKRINVVVQGLMLGHSGFAEATRNIAYELDKYFTVKTIIDDKATTNIDINKSVKGKRIIELQNTSIYERPIWITMTHPLGVHANLGYSIGYVMFETEKFPTVFVDNLMKQDEVWCPSEFNLKNMKQAGLPEVYRMPLGVDLERFNPNTIEPLKVPDYLEDKFIFLSIMGWSERKGVSLMTEAFCAEFTKDDDVALYIKGGWYDEFLARQETQQIKDKFKNPPIIHIDFATYPDSELPKLYQVCDCFVLASKGEGWGLNYSEAMAMEKPTIGTRWSSQVDFMNDKNSYLINLDKKEPTKIDKRCNWICNEYIGEKFANPDKKHLRSLMREVFTNREEAKQKGKQARQDLQNNFTWEMAGEKYRDRILKISKDMVKFKIGYDLINNQINKTGGK